MPVHSYSPPPESGSSPNLKHVSPSASDTHSESGRIKVFVRVRPLLPPELRANEPNIVRFDPTTKTSVLLLDHNVPSPTDQSHHHTPALSSQSGNNNSASSFIFDHVFPSDSTNRDVYRTVACPLVEACLQGFNGTLIAYGQTGTGKTTTLSGHDGMITRTLRHLFLRMHRDRYRCSYKVRLSYMQIYMEKIYDLLNDDLTTNMTTSHDLPLRESQDLGVFVEGLTEHSVRTEGEVVSLLAKGQRRLVFAETNMNRHSSRSHAICFLAVERHPASYSRPLSNSISQVTARQSFASLANTSIMSTTPPNTSSPSTTTLPPRLHRSVSKKPSDFNEIEEEGHTDDDLADIMDSNDGFHVDDTIDMVLRARLTLCDLAGSERVKKSLAKGLQLSEAKDINFSLLELGNVIQALAESKRHVPYRNSTLTRLLQDSLGGNSLSSLIVCISPTLRDVSETKGTLMFGMRAMRVKTHARINIEVDHEKRANELVQQLQLKETEWNEKERIYKDQLEELRLALLSHLATSAETSPIVANDNHASTVSSTLAIALAESNRANQSLITERARYRSALDALTTVIEGIQGLAATLGELVNQSITLSRVTALVSLTTSVATMRQRKSYSSGENRSASPVSATLQRIHDLSLTRGLGEMVAGNLIEIEDKRDTAVFDLITTAVSVTGDFHVDTALDRISTLSAPSALQIALSEVQPLTLARFELLAAHGRRSPNPNPPSNDNIVDTRSKTPPHRTRTPSQDTTSAQLWLTQLASVSEVVAGLGESVPNPCPNASLGCIEDTNEIAVAFAAARVSLTTMAQAIHALQALASHTCLTYGAVAVDLHRWYLVADGLASEIKAIELAVDRAEDQLDPEHGQLSRTVPLKERVAAVSRLVVKPPTGDPETTGDRIRHRLVHHESDLTLDEDVRPSSPSLNEATHLVPKPTSMTRSAHSRECGSSKCCVQ